MNEPASEASVEKALADTPTATVEDIAQAAGCAVADVVRRGADRSLDPEQVAQFEALRDRLTEVD